MIMPEVTQHQYFNSRLQKRDFKRLGAFIQSRIGIKMPNHKRIMVEARLRKRLRKLNLSSYSEYCDYLFSPKGMEKELVHFINVITTNKTEFFREPDHFRFLSESILPKLLGKRYRRISLWSAACSTGEEAYTLAMVLDHYHRLDPSCRFDFHIMATDISDQVIKKAERAIYDERLTSNVSDDFKKKYFLRSKDRTKSVVRVVPELRQKVRFKRINLKDGEFGLTHNMDIIFCRNVIIYFDKRTQEILLNRLCECLNPDGYLFMGHSEVLTGLDLPLTPVAPTVYQKQQAQAETIHRRI